MSDFFTSIVICLGALTSCQQQMPSKENGRRVLIIGSGNRAKKLVETIQSSGEEVFIVGYLDPDPTWAHSSVSGSTLGTIDDISVVLKREVIDEVIFAVPRGLISTVENVAHACVEEGVKLSILADLFEVLVARTGLVEMGSLSLLTLEPVAQERWKLKVKRCMDFVGGLLLLIILSPLMLLIAAAIKLDSPGPVFFFQERIGLKKRRFQMIKFRSMVNDADRWQAQIEHLNEAEGPIFKIANDPRITQVGRFLRRTSLDEFPQIFHVLSGKMSLVGPRPMSTRDVELFDRGIQRKRFSVKPGLTCIWQISGRSSLPFSKWLELDLQYIENWSLWLDLKILLKTLPAVLKGEGAV
jgi:exopolysaccharide biosynthesis polyprenyl glycosylphosphotransferase